MVEMNIHVYHYIVIIFVIRRLEVGTKFVIQHKKWIN